MNPDVGLVDMVLHAVSMRFAMWQADGLQANIVTFNTLIDAMGKAGRWQDAIGVLDIIEPAGGLHNLQSMPSGPCLDG